MVSYLVRHNYAGSVNGRRVAWRAGDVVSVDLADVEPLVRDGGADLLDWASPLSDDDVAALHRQRSDAAAAARASDVASVHLAAVRAHVRLWGAPLCPGRCGAVAEPVGYGMDGPHLERVDDLVVGTNAAGDLVVACAGHLGAWVASVVLPQVPPARDMTMRRYRVAHRYASTLTEYDAPRRLEFTAGEVVELAAWVAEWVNRDSPGALELIEE